MGHAGCYREEQPELAVWRFLYGVQVVILRLGGSDSVSGELIGVRSFSPACGWRSHIPLW